MAWTITGFLHAVEVSTQAVGRLDRRDTHHWEASQDESWYTRGPKGQGKLDDASTIFPYGRIKSLTYQVQHAIVFS